jgi:heme-degrading monooxygenase HmoA
MELITAAPPVAAITAMSAIDGLRIVPSVLNLQSGPERHLGPERAGAILMLQGTFADEERFNEFWMNVADMMRRLATAPGFIRRYNFADGPHYTLIALWRSLDDAHAFFASDQHQAALRSTFERRWNYTHFAGLWEATTPRRRLFFCQACDGVIPSTESCCTTCGTPLFDPFGGRDANRAADVS